MTLETVKQLIQANRLEEASEECCRLIDAGGDPEALYLLAVITSQMGLVGESLTLFEKAAQALPARDDVFYNFGIVLQQVGKLDEAIDKWSRAVALNPNHADAHFNIGRAYSDLQQWNDALVACERTARLKPDDPRALYNLGNVNYRLGRMKEARHCFQGAVARSPDYVQGWINLGLAELRDGKAEAAITALERAVAIEPESILAHFNLGQALLHAGRMVEGFAEVEWRRRVHELPFKAAAQEPWTGGDLDGRTILVYGEQGRGDIIQFLRYAGPLSERGAAVHVHCHPDLAAIAGRARGVAGASAFGDPTPPFDTYAPLMSLPLLLGLTAPGDIPPAPYVAPPGAAGLGEREDGVRVGLVWAGNPEHDNDLNRSAALRDLAPLFDVTGARFFSLQVGAPAGAIADAGLDGVIEDLGPGFDDFTDTAAAIEALDLVIAVDTAVPHLAGALGRPVWLLLPRVPDWRWAGDGEDTPWYGTMRLFRQTGGGGWRPVAERAAGALSAFAP